MKNLAVIVFILLVIVILGFYLVSFQVRETESALVTTFGKPTEPITKPGLYFKWPRPIQQVYKFDSRMRVFEVDLVETTTKGAWPIIVNTYVVWRISSPLDFFNSVGDVEEAENKLDDQIRDTQNRVIGQYPFSAFVNSDPTKVQFGFGEGEIEDDMLADLRGAVAKANYGIEVVTMGVKQLKVNEDVTAKAFERMREERKRMTDLTIAQGDAEAISIKADANSIRTELLAAADARAKSIQAEGDAEAARYYEMLEADPELAMFLRTIETAKETLKSRATIILREGSWLAELLREVPKIRPKYPKAGE